MKYLGVRVTVDKQEQRNIIREQIDKKVKLLRWRLARADSEVIQQLMCCLSRSMLIYLGTPMVAASLWKRQDIDWIEASLYRMVLGVSKIVSNKAILNTMTNIQLAGEKVINYLSKEAWVQFRR